jgi:hypothetical protein
MMTSQRATHLVLSHYHAVHGQQCDVVLLDHLTAAAMTRGGQQSAMVDGYIEVDCWHITSALLADVAFKRTHESSYTTVLAMPFYIFEARGPQRAAEHMVVL